MSSRFEALLGMGVIQVAFVVVGLLIAPRESARPDTALRVCVQPNNLPYPDEAGNGFENRLAEPVAGGMGRDVEYESFPEHRDSLPDTLRAERCDATSW